MAYSVSTFKTLLDKYSSWTELEAFLSSTEGGKIRCVGTGRYRVLRSVKGSTTYDNEWSRWLRSVVWDTETHRPVCVAPPKAEIGEPTTGAMSQTLLIQDFMDGTMINVFRTETEFQVTTRTQIGASGSFYSKKSFYDMFLEGLTSMGCTLDELKNLLTVPEGSSAHFVSFLLQHPEHRVVSRCRSPKLYFVHEGTVATDGTVNMQENASPSFNNLSIIPYPMTGFASTSDLDSFFRSLVEHNKQGWFWQGLTFKDGQGRRWRMRNPNYLYLRTLRGSEATAEDRFLRLRSEGKIQDYLKHYSEDRATFWDLEQILRSRTQNIYMAYTDVHKARKLKLSEVQKLLQPFVFRLHAHYLENLRPAKKSVDLKECIAVVNTSPLFELKRLLEFVVPVIAPGICPICSKDYPPTTSDVNHGSCIQQYLAANEGKEIEDFMRASLVEVKVA